MGEMKGAAVFCLAILGIAGAAAAADDPRALFEQAKAKQTELALLEFLDTSPPGEIVAEVRQALCDLRAPKGSGSSTAPPTNPTQALERVYVLNVGYLFSPGCSYDREIRESLVKAYRAYAEAEGTAEAHQKNFEQPAGASISKVVRSLRPLVLEGMEGSLSPTKLTIALDKKHPLLLRFAKLEMDDPHGELLDLVDLWDAVYALGYVWVDLSQLKLIGNTPPAAKPANPSAPPKYVATELTSLLIDSGAPTVTGAYVVNGKRIYCLDGGVRFDGREAEPVFTDGSRCVVDGQQVVYRGGGWR